jgi:hypothetical protein
LPGGGRAADMVGKVTLTGKPPAEIVIDAAADPACAQMHPTVFTTRHYVVGPGGGLADVFVYIKHGLEGKTYSKPGTVPVLDQEGCFYKPYVMGLMVGQDLKILNSDPTLHNVHAVPQTNSPFNLAQPSQGAFALRHFDKPEVFVKFKCDVHPWMFAYVGVVDHPYFAVTGPDGAFAIPNVPPGTYTLEAIHPKLGPLDKEITVSAAGNTTLDYSYETKSGN